jgi:hypothetical protein
LHPAADGPSPIAGRGLFATAPIPAGTAVFRFAAAPTSPSQLQTLNHSCDPNLWWTDGHTLVARRDIAAGDELTCDYSTWIADPGFLLRCHCGSSRCRQMVTGDDWQIPELQATYAGHWAPALEAAINAREKHTPAD